MDITTIFNQFAFPVAVVIALMWYIVSEAKAQRQQLKEKDAQIAALNNQHDAESAAFTDALNRNTVVLERLCALMGDRGTRESGT